MMILQYLRVNVNESDCNDDDDYDDDDDDDNIVSKSLKRPLVMNGMNGL